MRQFAAILLLLVYTCTGSTLSQLQKAPVLAEHFQEHKALNEHISLGEFLVMHYLSGNEKDADYERDMQLPFKTADYVTTASATAFIPSFFPELTFAPPLMVQVHGKALNEGYSSSNYLSTIWQPPKSC